MKSIHNTFSNKLHHGFATKNNPISTRACYPKPHSAKKKLQLEKWDMILMRLCAIMNQGLVVILV